MARSHQGTGEEALIWPACCVLCRLSFHLKLKSVVNVIDPQDTIPSAGHFASALLRLHDRPFCSAVMIETLTSAACVLELQSTLHLYPNSINDSG